MRDYEALKAEIEGLLNELRVESCDERRLCCTNPLEDGLSLPRTDLADGLGTGYAKSCESVEDHGADSLTYLPHYAFFNPGERTHHQTMGSNT